MNIIEIRWEGAVVSASLGLSQDSARDQRRLGSNITGNALKEGRKSVCQLENKFPKETGN